MREIIDAPRPTVSMAGRAWLLLIIIVLCSGLIASLMLDRGHSWGDDFAQYIMQARAIADGSMAEYLRGASFIAQNSDASLGAAVTAPWGLPLMLAPVYALFGTKLLAFKLVLVLCHMLFLVAFWYLARTRLTRAESLLLTAVLAFNTRLLLAPNEIIADLPFLLFSTLGLYLIERSFKPTETARGRTRLQVLLGLVLFAAAFTRRNGFLLFVPLAVAQSMHWRRSGSRARLHDGPSSSTPPPT